MPDEREPTIAVEAELTGNRVALRVERVRLDDGTEALRDVVAHPNSVVIVPVDANGDVVLVRQYRKAAERELLELPAGVLNEGETSPLDAARRELREETGLDAERIIPLGDFFAAPGSMSEQLFSFLATGLFPNPLPADEDERIEVERVPFMQLVSMARLGELHDAKTLASLLLAQPHVAAMMRAAARGSGG